MIICGDVLVLPAGGDVKLVFISVSTRGGCLLDKEDVELESRGHT